MAIVCLLAFGQACLQEQPEQNEDLDGYDDDVELRAHAQASAQAHAKAKFNRCGNGVVDKGEECDDGGTAPGDGCSELCIREACTWNVDNLSFPIDVRPGQAALGQITFDGNCDLIVSGGEELPYNDALYRVDRDDGSVSVVVAAADLPSETFFVPALTHRSSDNRLYFVAADPEQLYAVDDQDQLHTIATLDYHISGLTVAPQGFGEFGDQLIATAYAHPQLLAIDVETLTITPFAQSDLPLSVATFGKDGTLYVAEWGADQISTVSSEGEFATYVAGVNAPDGLAVSPDDAWMFVAYLQDGGRIDQISMADQTLTPGVLFELSTGFAQTGIVVDGANHVLYEKWLDGYSVIDVFDAP